MEENELVYTTNEYEEYTYEDDWDDDVCGSCGSMRCPTCGEMTCFGCSCEEEEEELMTKLKKVKYFIRDYQPNGPEEFLKYEGMVEIWKMLQ